MTDTDRKDFLNSVADNDQKDLLTSVADDSSKYFLKSVAKSFNSGKQLTQASP